MLQEQNDFARKYSLRTKKQY